ncbi:MAG: hypothetical protein M3315_04705 [Actinomycetota bacterium]|nr:hypothetical protein [Actinomycetota bacterium]
MKRAIYLGTAALVALMIFAPAAPAQEMMEEKMMTEDTTMMDQPQMMDQGKMMQQQMVPKTGGGSFGGPALILPATAALLLGSGVLGYATFRRRRQIH